jgi:hypothetical protein
MSQVVTVPLITAPTGTPASLVSGNSAWANGSYVQLLAATGAASDLIGVSCVQSSWPANTSGEIELDIAVGGAGAEVVVATFRLSVFSGAPGGVGYVSLPIGLPLGNGSRIAGRVRSGSSLGFTITMLVSAFYSENFDGSSITGKLLSSAPAGATGVSVTPSGSGWGNSSYAEIIAALGENSGLFCLSLVPALAAGICDYELDLAAGSAGAESVFTTIRGAWNESNTTNGIGQMNSLPAVYEQTSGTRIAARLRKTGTDATAWTLGLMYYGLPASGGGSTFPALTVAI